MAPEPFLIYRTKPHPLSTVLKRAVNCANCKMMMRLTKEQVEKITRLVLDSLKARGLIVFKADEEKVFSRMVEVFLEDLRAEDRLDKEVEKILETHVGTIDSERLDYRKMFNMIKGKLARERGMVL